jgi:O-antigen/teichoic acid export membrane protein
VGRIRQYVGSLSSFRREAAISVVFSFAFFLISAIQGPLLARSLGPEQRGDLAAVYVPFLTFGWVVSFGMPAAAAFYVRTVPERKIMGLSYRMMCLLAWPLALLLGFAVPAYLADRPEETIAGLRALLFVTTLMVPVEVAEAMIRGSRGAGLRFNSLRAARPLLCVVLLIGLAIAGHLTLTTAMAAFAVGTVVGGLIEMAIMRPPFTFQTESRASRRMVSFGLRSVGETGALTVVARLDQLILAGAGYRAELGLYSVAATLAQLSAPLSNGVAGAILPAMRRSGDERSARRLARRATLGVAAGSAAIAIVLALTAPLILRVAFGPDFEDAAVFVLLLLPGEVAYDIGNVMSASISARGRPGIPTQAMVLAAVAMAVLVPFAIERWGAEGAAVVTSVAYFLRLAYLVLRRNAPSASETAYSGGEPVLLSS